MLDLRIEEIEMACRGQLVQKNTSAETVVSSVVLDSRQVIKDSVFLATVGERVDGHRFIADVFAKGAALVITEKTPSQVEQEHQVPAKAWGSYLLVENSFEALKKLAEYYRSKLNIPIVGITGSVGKTSTKEMIASVLAQKYHVLKTEGNYNNEIGVPLTLLRIGKEHEAAVVEMGISDFGEMHRLSKMVRPNICVITNIGQCHLENLKDRAGILRAKTEIFDFMDKEGHVVLNGEDDMLTSVQEVHGKRPHFYGLGKKDGEEVFASDIQSRGILGSRAMLHIGKENRFWVEIPLLGEHMVGNAAAAACVGNLLGLNTERIAKGISKVQALDGRGHLISLSFGTLIDDCYNANPVSMKAALKLLSETEGTRVAIVGDMFELGETTEVLHAEVGAYAAKLGLERLICVGTLAEKIYLAAENEKGQARSYFPDRESFLDALKKDRLQLIPENSTVLVKASHGMGFAEVVAFLKNDTETN